MVDDQDKARASRARSFLDSKVLERIAELDKRALLTSEEHSLAAVKSKDIERLALLDTLTDLYNSRTFKKELVDEIRRAKRYKRPVTVCMVAIDSFKEIKKQYGAQTSDAVLKVVAEVLISAIRDVDVPARFTTEEFAIIFPETNASSAAIIAERIRQQVAKQSITHNWHNLEVTVSIGLAAFPVYPATKKIGHSGVK